MSMLWTVQLLFSVIVCGGMVSEPGENIVIAVMRAEQSAMMARTKTEENKVVIEEGVKGLPLQAMNALIWAIEYGRLRRCHHRT